MDKQPGQDSEGSRSISVPSRKYYIYDAKSPKFPESFQELFQFSVADVPFLFRRNSLDPCFKYCAGGKQDEPQENERLFSEEMLSLARKKSEKLGDQYQANDAKFRAQRNGYPSPSAIFYDRGSNSDLLFPFPVYPASADNFFPRKSDEPPLMPTEYEAMCKEEFASSQSIEERNKKSGNANDKYSGKGNEFTSSESLKMRRMELSRGEGKASNIAFETPRYWERRRRNNASAKKSRDARRARELQTQIQVAFLEKENMRMLAELMAVRQENVCLRRVLTAQI